MACPTPFVNDCICHLDCVWADKGIIIYPRSKLVVCNGLLVQYSLPTHKIFGIHRLERKPDIMLWAEPAAPAHKFLYLVLTSYEMGLYYGDWANAQNDGITNPYTQNMMHVYGVGLACVRTLQRWFRRVLSKWKSKWMSKWMSKWKNKRDLMAMMATHKCVGAASLLHGLGEALLQQLCCTIS